MISATHLHAMLVHFPIALLIVGFLFQLIGLFRANTFYRKAALYLLVLGALGTVATYLSGDQAGEGIEDGPLEAPMDLHEDAATFTLWLTVATGVFFVALALLKYTRTWTTVIGTILFAAVVGGIARTGYLGGQLVYQHGAGVELGIDLPPVVGGGEGDED
ncbi:MAG: DUF2231 domain-containing protein [Flavobacteriales bacterium]